MHVCVYKMVLELHSGKNREKVAVNVVIIHHADQVV
jgi:hypothetical protein